MGVGEVLFGLGGRRRRSRFGLSNVVGHRRGGGLGLDLDRFGASLRRRNDLQVGIVGVLGINRERTHGLGASFRRRHQFRGFLFGCGDGRLRRALGDRQFGFEFSLGGLELAHLLVALRPKLLQMRLNPLQLSEVLFGLAPCLVAFALEHRNPFQRLGRGTAGRDVVSLLLDLGCSPSRLIEDFFGLTPRRGQLLLGEGDVAPPVSRGVGVQRFGVGACCLQHPLRLGSHRCGALLGLGLDLRRLGASSVDDAVLGVEDGIHGLVDRFFFGGAHRRQFLFRGGKAFLGLERPGLEVAE